MSLYEEILSEIETRRVVETDQLPDWAYDWPGASAVDALIADDLIVIVTDDSTWSAHCAYVSVSYLTKLLALGLVDETIVPGSDGDPENGPRRPDWYYRWAPGTLYNSTEGAPNFLDPSDRLMGPRNYWATWRLDPPKRGWRLVMMDGSKNLHNPDQHLPRY